MARDITSQDWQTFVNYLIPNFFAVNNERVIDRKLRAEGVSLPTGSIPGDGGNDGSRTHAEAQLEQIRSPLPGTGTPTTPQGFGSGLSESRRREVEQTIREWNEGFFGLRGVNIRLGNTNTEDVLHVMPGGWDASFDSTANAPGEAGPSAPAAGNSTNNGDGAGARSRFARFMPQFGGGGPTRGGPRGPFGLGIPGVGGGGPGSFRMGGIAVDGDRVSIGDRFVADRNGVRIGPFVADNNGITVNGQRMFGMGPNVGGTRGMCNPGNGSGHPGWGGFGGGRGCHDGNGGPWGRGWGGRGGGRGHHGRGWGGRHGRGHSHDDPNADDEDHGRGHHGHNGHRGRSRGRERQDAHRSRSRSSSVSSTSSSSSSGSESSIGSLPDYDELRESQLPVARDHLLAWLHNPDQPITKEKLKEFKQKIKEAKNVNGNNSSTGINEPVNIAHDQKAMRKEVKALMKEWKDLERQQTKLRRQLRKERKQQRRAEKRERRNTRREVKRAEREQRREQKRANRRNGDNGCSSSASSSSVPFPGVDHPHFPFPTGRVPGVPGVPPIPGAPQSHHTFPFTGGPFGGPGNNGGRGGHGGFFGPFGLFGGHQPPNQFPFQGGEGVTSTGGTSGQPQAPGAWPTEHNDRNDTTIHVASQAKYKAANDLEEQLVQKETELFKLHEAVALAADADADARSSSLGNHSTSDAPSAKNEKQRLAARDLEEEIEDLAKRMALMRTEADAEYARELAGMAD